MATLDYNDIVIYDNAPGPVHQDALPPADSNGQHFTNSTHHNVASPAYPLGYKVSVLDHTEGGYSLLGYFKYTAGAVTLAAGHPCVAATGEMTTVTNDGDAATANPNSFLAIALSAMTDGYYGWFWIGWLPPTSYCSELAASSDTITTDGNVTATSPLAAYDLNTTDKIALKPLAAGLKCLAFATAADV